MRSGHISFPNPRRTSGFRRAFTLFEMTVVVLIIGIASAAILAAVGGDIRSAKLATAANVVATDIEFCQGECINHPDSLRQIKFDLTNNKYSVQIGSTVVPHPADSLPFTNDFSTGRNAQLSGVTLTGLVMGSTTPNLLSFDAYGRPSTDPSGTPPITSDFVITLTYRGNTMHVTVKQSTGDVTIQ